MTIEVRDPKSQIQTSKSGVPQLNSSFTHPVYRAALRHMQCGEWEAGLIQMEWLVSAFPLEPELRALRQEMVLRAKVDLDEARDRSTARRRRVRSAMIWISIVVLLVIAGALGGRHYASAIAQRLQAAQANLQLEFQGLEQAVKFRDAVDLLEADRPGEALALLEEVAADEPEYPGLEQALEQARRGTTQSETYDQALARIEEGDINEALVILKTLAAEEPFFRDVGVRIEALQREVLLEEILSLAEADFQAGNWESAISGFEKVHLIDLEYRRDLVEERLFQSYVKAGQGVLAGKGDSLLALAQAESYYRKALSVRPQNPEIKSQREMARFFLDAQENFSQGLWSETIESLETIQRRDPDYAYGTARQTLYEAYTARGDEHMGTEAYGEALADYQRAAQLAELTPEAALRLYQARIKLAEARSAAGQSRLAVDLYRSALEMRGVARAEAEAGAAFDGLVAEAELAASEGDYQAALEYYRQAISSPAISYEMIAHTVESGEYLTRIASQYGSTVQAIVEANGISDPNRIFPRQQLLVPVLR